MTKILLICRLVVTLIRIYSLAFLKILWLLACYIGLLIENAWIRWLGVVDFFKFVFLDAWDLTMQKLLDIFTVNRKKANGHRKF